MLSPRGAVKRALRIPHAAGGLAGDALERLSPGRRHRRVWVREGRAHIEVRGMDRAGYGLLVKDLEAALNAVPGVQWAQVNPVLGRVVVVFDSEDPTVDDLLEVIEGIEAIHEVADERFPHDRPEHPGDFEPLRRETIAIGADVVGLGVSVFGQLLRATPFPVELASLVSLVDNEPRLRGFLEHHIGAPSPTSAWGSLTLWSRRFPRVRSAWWLTSGTATDLRRESQERRRSWERREGELNPGRDRQSVLAGDDRCATDAAARRFAGALRRQSCPRILGRLWSDPGRHRQPPPGSQFHRSRVSQKPGGWGAKPLPPPSVNNWPDET